MFTTEHTEERLRETAKDAENAKERIKPSVKIRALSVESVFYSLILINEKAVSETRRLFLLEARKIF